MKQIAFLALFNALLSFVMFVIAAIVIIRTIPAAKLLLDSDLRHKDPSELRAMYGDPVREVRRVLWLLESVFLPIIAVTIGTISGFMSKVHPVPVALLGILPMETFFLRFCKFRVKDVFPFVGYAALASGTALIVFYLRVTW